MRANPTQILSMIKGGKNPQQLVMNILEQQAQNNPMGANLLQLVKDNKTADIEQIVRNYAKSQGVDFDKEFNAFKQMLGIK
jgi:hypothetical protein